MDELKQIIPDDTFNKIINIFEKSEKGDEFEVIFTKKEDDRFFTYEKYMNLLYYSSSLKNDKNKNYEIKYIKILDIILSINSKNYRLSINESENGIKIIDIIKESYYKQNYVIFKNIIEKYIEGVKGISFINKVKEDDEYVDVSETPYPLRFRLSSEKTVDSDTIQKLLKFIVENNNSLNNHIIFRYKDRVSIISKNKISIDITAVKMSNNITLLQSNTNYELEIENLEIGKKQLEYLFLELSKILKILENNNVIISHTESKNVILLYSRLLGLKDSATFLRGRNVISLEIKHVLKKLSIGYSITDKIDGDRMFLMIFNENIYLCSTFMKVIKMDRKIKREYNDTIIDGEYVKLHNGKMIFCAFDILFYKGKDVRSLYFKERLENLDTIVKELDKNTFFMEDYFKNKNSKFNINEITQHIETETLRYLEYIKELSKKDNFQIFRKLYVFPYGGCLCEIYCYSKCIWDVMTKNKLMYEVDGLIYTPINSEYINEYNEEYKWKPPEMNSIDFFISFEKDESGKPIIFYDDSEQKKSRPYIIVNLKVGNKMGNREEPVNFTPNGESAKKAYFYLNNPNDYPRDKNGNIIQDNTVVEFVYDLKNIGIDSTRWVALRTRQDKTYIALKLKKKFGNERHVAENIWRSIHENFTIDDIIALCNETNYNVVMESLSKRLRYSSNHERLISTPQERIYYEKKTELGGPMRAFHNWIKTSMISLYCSNNKEILDIACGRGGDLPKIIPLEPKRYVGVDNDYGGLFTIEDSAVNRLKNLTHGKNTKNFEFIHADGGELLAEKVKGTFDIISIQFALHYFLKTEKSFLNLCENINTFLKNDGYLIITCFDGEKINNSKGSIEYTDLDGKKNLLFDIKKLYQQSEFEKNLTGNIIDVYNSIISDENVYIKEAVVDSKKLINRFQKECGLNLVETELFENVFNLNKKLFSLTTEKKYNNIKTYYELLDSDEKNNLEKNIAQACFEITKLNRLYVFQKKVINSNTDQSRLFNGNLTIQNIKNKSDGSYSLKTLKEHLHSEDFYMFEKEYTDIQQIKKEYDLDKSVGVVLVKNKSKKMFVPEKGKNKLIVNNSIEIKKDDNKEQYIFIYYMMDKYYVMYYLTKNKKKKIIFTKNNKFINFLL